MTIRILANRVAGGWEPTDLAEGLGGSEESVVLLAGALNEYYTDTDVVVYHPQKDKRVKEFRGVKYGDRSDFFCEKDDIVILFKIDPLQVEGGVDAKQIFHWSCEVKAPFSAASMDKIDYFVNVSEYHRNRNFWVEENKNLIIPFGVETHTLDEAKCDRDENLMLYCSSLDRGLVTLLEGWGAIRYYHPNLKLKVAYGFGMLDAMVKEDMPHQASSVDQFKKRIFNLMQQEGIEYIGHQNKQSMEKLYWQAQYWCLPLQIPDAELFCLNAVKAQYTGAMPVVNKIGALRNTVGRYIKYTEFAEGNLFVTEENAHVGALTWNSVVEDYWSKVIDI